MLTRIRIQNYRAFEQFECEFGPRQLILGRNGAGKSSIFDVLNSLRSIVIDGELLNDHFGISQCTRWLNDPQLHVIQLGVAGNDGHYEYELTVLVNDRVLAAIIVDESVKFNGTLIFKCRYAKVTLYTDDGDTFAEFPHDGKRSALASVMEAADNTRLIWLKRWFQSFHFVAPDPCQISPIAAKESGYLNPSLSNFAEWYRHVSQEKPECYQDFLQDLQEVIPRLGAIQLTDAGAGRRELKARMKPPESISLPLKEEVYTFSELSDGQRILIALYAILHFAAKPGATLCFDEPDNYLSLFEIQPWLTRLLEKTEEENGVQVLIASHHPEIINWMAFKEGLVLDRPDGLGVTVQPFRDKDNTGLTASELVTRGWDVE